MALGSNTQTGGCGGVTIKSINDKTNYLIGLRARCYSATTLGDCGWFSSNLARALSPRLGCSTGGRRDVELSLSNLECSASKSEGLSERRLDLDTCLAATDCCKPLLNNFDCHV